MTREVAHYQQFTAALNELPVNFSPGQLPADDRFHNVAFNMSDGDGESIRGPWNQGQGPWPQGMEWEFVDNPVEWLGSQKRKNKGAERNPDGSPGVQGESRLPTNSAWPEHNWNHPMRPGRRSHRRPGLRCWSLDLRIRRLVLRAAGERVAHMVDHRRSHAHGLEHRWVGRGFGRGPGRGDFLCLF